MTSVHLLTGDDDLLLQRATERLLSQLTSADAELSVDTYDASELDALPELRTQSLFGGRVCAVIRGLHGVRADLKGELEDYLEAPDDQAVLVLVAEGTGKVQKIARLAKEHGEVTKVTRPPDWKTREWRGHRHRRVPAGGAHRLPGRRGGGPRPRRAGPVGHRDARGAGRRGDRGGPGRRSRTSSGSSRATADGPGSSSRTRSPTATPRRR